jgi:predicted phosphodiesterase
MAQSVLIIGDTHFPYTDADGIKKVIAAAKATKPTYIVQMGDLFDQYAFSKYPTNPNYGTPKAELDAAIKDATKMWADLQRAAPAAKCYQLLGNHDVRLSKRIAEKLPELCGTGLVRLADCYQFEGVETQQSDRDVLELRVNDEPVAFHHGWLSKLGDHVKYFGQSCVVGHSHSPGVVYHRRHNAAHFELNAGYLGNPRSHVFSYGATAQKWTRAYASIDMYGPRVVALES